MNRTIKPLLLIGMTFAINCVNAQWNGPVSNTLSTSNNIKISLNGGTTGMPGTVFPNIFETELTGVPVGSGVVSSTLYPLCVSYQGKVGIGTNAPTAALDIKGGLRIRGNTNNPTSIETFTRGNLTITTDGSPISRGLFIKSPTADIFSVTPEYMLFTDGSNDFMKVDNNGQLYARKMIVTLTNPFPDYVFKKDYKLMPLNELALFISTHNHLPNMKSAEEIATNNKQIEVGEMQVKLLEKVEELTLYILQQQQQIDELKSKLGAD